MSGQQHAAAVNGEKKKRTKTNKSNGRATRVVAMASAPMVLSEDERLMAALVRFENTESTDSDGGNGNAKPDEKEEGEIDEGEVKGEVKGNGEAAADKPAAADAPKE